MPHPNRKMMMTAFLVRDLNNEKKRVPQSGKKNESNGVAKMKLIIIYG